MTKEAYIKILLKRIERKEESLNELSKRRYNPASYKDYNAFYIQEEIKFIKAMIKEYTE